MPSVNGQPPKAQVTSTTREVLPDVPSDLEQKKLILCFDGTSNSFVGTDEDTNVVKLFSMLDRRSDKLQYHYYQPGIGTYAANANISNVQNITIGTTIAATVDEMFAGSFAEHVLAGYKFLMRYYMEGDKVYIFGFSRGAYTARFLTELLDSVGLLSKGNEENLPFLWYQYGQYRRNPDNEEIKAKLSSMSTTFCRVEPPKDVDETTQRPPFVYFLGLWDCVNSVATFMDVRAEIESHASASPNIARHIRHAVAGGERRVMFLPTLFLSEQNTTGTCVERWFAGNHGDCGGGWPRSGEDLLLSDIPLMWMVDELQKQEKLDDEPSQISWNSFAKGTPGYKNTVDFRRSHLENTLERIKTGKTLNATRLRHDVLSFRRCGGVGIKKALMVAVWWFMECLPLKHRKLMLLRRPHTYFTQSSNRLHVASARRIPLDAQIDPSVDILSKHKITGPLKFGNEAGARTVTKDKADFQYFDTNGV